MVVAKTFLTAELCQSSSKITRINPHHFTCEIFYITNNESIKYI